MDFVLTDHVRKRCTKRKIEVDWIRQALKQHLHIKNDTEDDSLVHVFYPVLERGFRVLRVIYNETVEPMTIVTAYFDEEVKIDATRT